MGKFLQSCLNKIARKFSDDPSKMLITTSVVGWSLSSLAQIIAVAVNPKIKEEQKVFLIPQEFNDALVNIGAFLLITQFTKKTVTNLFKTGKFAPVRVKEYLYKNSHHYKDKIGKLDLNLDEVLKTSDKETLRAYNTYKTFGTTVATVGAGILSANIVTPLIRNKMASKVQKSYINVNSAPAVVIQEVPKPEDQTVNKTETALEKTQVPKPQINVSSNNGSMRI